MDKNREIWALALWVEKHHGDDGLRFIAEQIHRLQRSGEIEDEDLWWAVAARFEQLMNDQGAPN